MKNKYKYKYSGSKKRRGNIRSQKVIYKGIQYASKLEVTMVMLLEDAGISFIYEKTFDLFKEDVYPNKVFLRAQRRSIGMKDSPKMEKRVYTPDFICPDMKWVIEVKGRKNESFPMRWRIFLARMKQKYGKDAPMLFMPTNKKDCIQTVDIIKKYFSK